MCLSKSGQLRGSVGSEARCSALLPSMISPSHGAEHRLEAYLAKRMLENTVPWEGPLGRDGLLAYAGMREFRCLECTFCVFSVIMYEGRTSWTPDSRKMTL